MTQHVIVLLIMDMESMSLMQMVGTQKYDFGYFVLESDKNHRNMFQKQ